MYVYFCVRNNYLLVFVQWIVVLSSVPDLELLSYLPTFLDGIFGYLSDESSGDVRVGALGLLDGFLKEIRDVVNVQRSRGAVNLAQTSPASKAESAEVSLAPSVGNVSTTDTSSHAGDTTAASIESSKKDDPIQLPPGIDESRPYIQGQGVLIDFKSMTEILVKNLGSLGLKLDHLYFNVQYVDHDTQATALSWINEFILLAREEILSFTSEILHHVLPSLSSPSPQISPIAHEANINLFHLISETDHDFSLFMTVDTLQHQFLDENEGTRIESIEWLLMLVCYLLFYLMFDK